LVFLDDILVLESTACRLALDFHFQHVSLCHVFFSSQNTKACAENSLTFLFRNKKPISPFPLSNSLTRKVVEIIGKKLLRVEIEMLSQNCYAIVTEKI
jgi:hypothetical protein